MKKLFCSSLLFIVLTACAPAATPAPAAPLAAPAIAPTAPVVTPTPDAPRSTVTPWPTNTRVVLSPTPTAPPTPIPTPTFATPEPWRAPGQRYYFPVQPPDIARYSDEHHDYPATDIFVPVGSTVVAVTDGVVNEVRRFDPWNPKTDKGEDRPGLFVAIVGDDGVRYHTSHLSAVQEGIEPGVRVRAGQIIGLSGKSGNARNTPPHVHLGISRPLGPGDWQVRRGEVWPYVYLEAWAAGQDRTPILPVYPWFKPFILGASAGGRPLVGYRLGQGPSVKAILGGIHGGYEWNTTALVEQMLDELKTRPELVPVTTTLYIIPLLNPDGAASGAAGEGRYNARGVDLNRNWDVDWRPEAVLGDQPVNPGARPFSEPETRALRNFLVWYQVQAVLSYHSHKGAIYGDPMLGQVMSQATGYPYELDGIGYPTSGDLHRWCQANGIFEIDIELTDHDNIEWARNRRGLLAFLGWTPPHLPANRDR